MCGEKSCFHPNLSATPSGPTMANSAELGRRFLKSSISCVLRNWQFWEGSYGGLRMAQQVGTSFPSGTGDGQCTPGPVIASLGNHGQTLSRGELQTRLLTLSGGQPISICRQIWKDEFSVILLGYPISNSTSSCAQISSNSLPHAWLAFTRTR
jgi:hypothetical protein